MINYFGETISDTIFWHIHDLFLIGEFFYMIMCYGYEYLGCVAEVVTAGSVAVNYF